VIISGGMGHGAMGRGAYLFYCCMFSLSWWDKPTNRPKRAVMLRNDIKLNPGPGPRSLDQENQSRLIDARRV